MRELAFVAVLMLALAVPSMAGTYSGGGEIGDFCHISSEPLTITMGGPADVGWFITEGNTWVNANIDCSITCAVEAGGVDNRMLGQNTNNSVQASIQWKENGAQTLAVPKPQIDTLHVYEFGVLRSGHADLGDVYSCTLIFGTIPP